ncbi:2762_t:CDS:2 [Acaulospora colombiana]|uniref:2762_t:CDS:1 n=1 Tax=Acaulospora colombiana TaxID=27376 RepID=A0ACA9KWR7_9GLOM|nr:2762_t:CDS:2 [Acaulospora colombiana]
MSKKIKVNVIGAGVIGLTTALILQKNGYQVQILSEHWPGDFDINYSSPWATATWRANPNIDDEVVHGKISWNEFWKLSETPEIGLMRVKIYDFMDKKPELERDMWFKDLVPEFRVIPPEELPSGVEYGLSYTTVSLNVQKYLHWLLHQFTTNGGVSKKVHLSHIDESFYDSDDVGVVVNCSGVSARTLGGVADTTVLPSRGQTVSVWAPHIKTVYILSNRDSFTFIVPRESGEVILGGTMSIDD